MVTCVPLDDVLAGVARRSVVPADWFTDHCHPSKVGTEQIGAVLAEVVAKMATR